MADAEYSSGELMRAIQQLRGDFKDITSRFVPMDLYLRDRKEHSDDIAEVKVENRGLRTDLDASRKEAEAARAREDEQRQKTRVMWLGIIAAPMVTAAVAFLLSGGLTP